MSNAGILPTLETRTTGQRFLRLPQVKERTGVSKSFLYAGCKNGTFPLPIKIGARAVGWLESEINAWVDARAARRDQEAA